MAIVIGCYIFFIGFNIFEPILPAIVLKTSSALNRGQSSSMLALAQFSGSFCGALIAGAFYNNLTLLPLIILILLLGIIWIINQLVIIPLIKIN